MHRYWQILRSVDVDISRNPWRFKFRSQPFCLCCCIVRCHINSYSIHHRRRKKEIFIWFYLIWVDADISMKYFFLSSLIFLSLFHCNVTVRHFETSGRRYFNVLDFSLFLNFITTILLHLLRKMDADISIEKSPLVATVITTILVAVISMESLYIFLIVFITIIFVSHFEIRS